jgi:hypothetical protein
LARSLFRHLQRLATQVKKENIRMLQINHELLWYAKRAGVMALVLVLGVLILCGHAVSLPKPGGALPAVPNNDKDQEFTRVYQHTYDEVFRATQETIERMGLYVTAKDKDKGTISGNGNFKTNDGQAARPCTFDIHIEVLNTKPETRVTVSAKAKSTFFRGNWEAAFKNVFSDQLQKVLSTYH